MCLLFNFDIVNLHLTTSGRSNRRPNFVIFVVSIALIIGGWKVVGWTRKSFRAT